ncbi:hypothetical protein M407DRAFT_139830 [Tulasnella calospora MUT 4182]|uniref:Uncharacterized protein n=1 Tax=Tulasnella calospora MUT 4182 TaxID=1051891 RepID=A0A0C3Q8T3_9AGAM|nr:hypothetical protein M407DRAFT_139830 [Tulasnella calospora MUT 4182]
MHLPAVRSSQCAARLCAMSFVGFQSGQKLLLRGNERNGRQPSNLHFRQIPCHARAGSILYVYITSGGKSLY